MDVQSEHFTAQRRFYYDTAEYRSLFLSEQKKSDCTFKHVHFDPNMFSNIILENEGVLSDHINACSFIFFAFLLPFLGRRRNRQYIRQADQPLYRLWRSVSGSNINISLINLMLYILDHTKPAHHFSNPQLQNSYVAYTLNYIAEHYTEKIIQEDIASQLHISVRYLSKLFKAHIGITLSSYINVYRINHSISLMQNTKLSLTEIALQSGFTNSQHYSKVFRDCVNTTPSQYRKSI